MISRRLFVKTALGAGAAMLVSACTNAAPPATPTSPPAPKPTEPSKPATTAAPTAAPTAASKAAPTTAAGAQGKLQALPDGFPSKALAILSLQPGSAAEIVARTMATAAEPFSPVPVTVEPQEVNSSVLVSTFLRRPTAQDGHELVQMTDSPVVASFTGQAQFDPKDLQVVLEVSKYPILLTMRSDQPWKSVEELAEYAKANPGKVRIAIPASAGSNHHIGFLAIQRALGAQLVMLPNQSSNEAALTVLGGGAELCQTPYSAVGPHVKEGTMRVLASVGSVRAEEAPDAPTFKELGYEVEIDNIQFLSVPAAVPKDRVTWLHQLFVRALQQEETQRLLRERGFPPPPTILSPEEATASLQKRAAEYETGVKEAGLYKPRQ